MPAGWGTFCGDELAAATATAKLAAGKTLNLAHDLAVRLPRTARALHEGTITLYKARLIAGATGDLTAAEAAAAEALILDGAAGKTPGQLRAVIARAVVTVNPAAAQARRERAQRDARVELWREDAGTAALCGRDLPPADALAADQRITAYARDLRAAGLDGTLDQLRARAFLDLALGVRSHPPCPGHPGEPGTRGSGQQSSSPAEGGTADDSATGTGARADAGAGESATGDGAAGTARSDSASNQDAGKDAEVKGATGNDGSTDSAGGTSLGAGGGAGLAARINLTIPLATLLGLAERPGEAAGLGAIDPALARTLANPLPPAPAPPGVSP